MGELVIKPPIWYWIIAGLLAVWGVVGLFVYYDFVVSTPVSMAKYVDAGTYSQAYADYLLASPAWSTSVFALAVTTGAIGSIFLLLRRKWANTFYIMSLFFIIISLGNMFLFDKAHKLMTNGQIAMEGVVFSLGVLAVWMAWTAKNKDWLK